MSRVIVIGGANVDIKGRASEAIVGGSSNIGEVTMSPGGVGRNIAENLARLDVDVALLTTVGGDANGSLVIDSCREAGVDVSLIGMSAAPTGVYLALLDAAGEMVAAINDMRAADSLSVAHLERAAGRLRAAHLLVADCNIGTACLEWLCGFSATQGVPLLIEPVSVAKSRKLLAFARPSPVFAITPNVQQLHALTGLDDPRLAIPALHDLGFANVVAHCGKEGALVSDGRRAPIAIPAFHVSEVADVTGAGDAAVAGLVCGLAEGRSLVDAARMGQAAAALKLRSRKSVSEAMSRASVVSMAG